VSQEALRCIANALLLQPKARQILIDLGHGPDAAEKLKASLQWPSVHACIHTDCVYRAIASTTSSCFRVSSSSQPTTQTSTTQSW
jgi:hypothetical protein